MHELSLAQGILRVALRAAENGHAERIVSVYVKTGAYSGVVPSYLDECFALMSKGTPAEGAKLQVEEIPVVVRCQSCGGESQIDRTAACCPCCGSSEIRMVHGRECYVDRIEAE